MKKVVVYSQDNCVFCKELKDLLGQNMVNYIEKAENVTINLKKHFLII